MLGLTQLGRVLVPVSDQDAAIAFYTEQLDFSLAADVPFGDGERWVEVEPPAGGPRLALVPGHDGYGPGRKTGIALSSTDVRGDCEELRERGVDVDEPIGGEGEVPLMFFLRDADGNTLLVVDEG